MSGSLENIYDFFWCEQWWLGKYAKWEDFTSNDRNIYYPIMSDMNCSIIVGILLFVIRFVYERVFIVPLANALHVYERKPITLAPSATLESAFRKQRGHFSHTEIEVNLDYELMIFVFMFNIVVNWMLGGTCFGTNIKLGKRTGMTERQIERWLYRKRLLSQPSSLYKFKECSWHLLLYTCTFSFGLWSLWDKPWLWKTYNCWVTWPFQPIDWDIYLFYLVELSLYWSLLFSMLFLNDYKKKDKKEMIFHHCITICLIYFSWTCNFVRVGTLVLVVHDIADPWVAIAKMAKYSNHQTICEIFFAIFIVIWILSRCFVFPLWVIGTTAFEVHSYLDVFPAYYFFNTLLCALQLLHLMWTYLILRVAFQKFQHGALQKDTRSESEAEVDDTSSDSTTVVTWRSVSNGNAKPRSQLSSNHLK